MFAPRGVGASIELITQGVTSREMDVNTSILLICAVLASLAFGVLMAYWTCLAMFQVFRVHSRQVQERRAALRPIGVAQS